MKKDRNSFFSEYGFNAMNSGMNPGPNMMMPQGGMQGPGMMEPNPYGGPQAGGGMPMPTDIDSRISKLERQLNRLETRVSKLEGDSGTIYNETDYNFNNSMYMV